MKLQEKIDIFTHYFAEGNKGINGKTVFEGYPIGQWAIQIRSMLKRDDGSIKLTEEQRYKLSSWGILDKKIDSTIDEKIDALVEWRTKYPDILIERTSQETISETTIEQLRELAYKEKIPFDELLGKYEKLQSYIEYVGNRYSKGKLTEEQKKKCKDGKLGGRFGFATEIEEVAKKYNITPELANEIIATCGSIENAIRMYRSSQLSESMAYRINRELIDNLRDVDLNKNSENYRELIYTATFKSLDLPSMQGDIIFFSSKKIDEVLHKLKPREQAIIREHFGLDTGEHKTVEECGNNLGIARAKAREILSAAQRRLSILYKINEIRIITIGELKNHPNVTQAEKGILTELEKTIWTSKAIYHQKEIHDKSDFDSLRLSYLFELDDALKGREKEHKVISSIQESEHIIDTKKRSC